MQTNVQTIAESRPPCQADLGILAIPLRALEDFAPMFIPAAGHSRDHVLATCPICVGEPGSLGSLRVEAIDTPPRLSWRCALHRGGFSGISYALEKHRVAMPVIDLVQENLRSICTNSITPEVDPVADHQREFTCTNPGRLIKRADQDRPT